MSEPYCPTPIPASGRSWAEVELWQHSCAGRISLFRAGFIASHLLRVPRALILRSEMNSPPFIPKKVVRSESVGYAGGYTGGCSVG